MGTKKKSENSGQSQMIETQNLTLSKYSFPEYGIEVEATTQSEAEEKMRKILSSHS